MYVSRQNRCFQVQVKCLLWLWMTYQTVLFCFVFISLYSVMSRKECVIQGKIFLWNLIFLHTKIWTKVWNVCSTFYLKIMQTEADVFGIINIPLSDLLCLNILWISWLNVRVWSLSKLLIYFIYCHKKTQRNKENMCNTFCQQSYNAMLPILHKIKVFIKHIAVTSSTLSGTQTWPQ